MSYQTSSKYASCSFVNLLFITRASAKSLTQKEENIFSRYTKQEAWNVAQWDSSCLAQRNVVVVTVDSSKILGDPSEYVPFQ